MPRSRSPGRVGSGLLVKEEGMLRGLLVAAALVVSAGIVSAQEFKSEAQPLFHRAIMQSGAPSLIHDRETSRQVAGRYFDRLPYPTRRWKPLTHDRATGGCSQVGGRARTRWGRDRSGSPR